MIIIGVAWPNERSLAPTAAILCSPTGDLREAAIRGLADDTEVLECLRRDNMAVRWGLASLIAIGLFFGLNLGWTRAALASLVTAKSTCSIELESAARRRVEEFFGQVHASPRFVCLNEPRLGLNVSHGTARFAPFLPTFIVLGPHGQVIDVAAHEFAHAEIAARTSALLRTYVVPTWFDEGLAMQLDKRADYSAASLTDHIRAGRLDRTGLADLRWPSGFFRNDETGKAHYAFAKCVVGRWSQRAGRASVNSTLAAVAWWNAFPITQFSDDEAFCKKLPS